ncbi:MAG: hypothetical protein ACRYFU_24700 [Janthinobacterium lividum]
MQYGIFLATTLSLTWFGCGPVAAQEVVHALSGTFQKVNPQTKTIQISTNDGSEGVFSFRFDSGKTEVAFERDVQDRVKPVASFAKVNEPIVIYYYGNDAVRIAVGVQDLGSGPLDTVEGVISRLDKRHQQISIKDSSGKEHTLQIDPKTMADSPMGAIPAKRLSASKGDNVRVIATKASGTETALFIHD